MEAISGIRLWPARVLVAPPAAVRVRRDLSVCDSKLGDPVLVGCGENRQLAESLRSDHALERHDREDIRWDVVGICSSESNVMYVRTPSLVFLNCRPFPSCPLAAPNSAGAALA